MISKAQLPVRMIENVVSPHLCLAFPNQANHTLKALWCTREPEDLDSMI